MRDLRDRVLRHLAGETDQSVPAGVIVAADDMPPSMFLATDWRDGGLVLRRGSPSSHVAILARSRGVPMIVGVDVDHLENGAEALLDGNAGLLIVNPDGDMRASYCQRRAEQSEVRQAVASFSGPALTAAGEPVRVMINVTGLAELRDIDPAHVDGIGLMRTEFLFQGREKLPTEEEQYQIYKRMLEWAAGRPVTIRTLDAGGDKPIAGLTQPGDGNPISWRTRRAVVIATSGRLSRAVAGAGPRCSGGKSQGDDSNGHGAGGTRPLPCAFRASR